VGRNAIRIELECVELVETRRLLTQAVKEFENQEGTQAPFEVCAGFRIE
jgi:hypothetical protein